MATWPATLPAPQKQLSFSPGSNLVRRKLQSGRVEVRRFGSGAPGRIEAVFRLKADQLGAFEYFYERNLCLGVNWFTASWLNTGDKARFLGHPRTLGRLGEYFDIAATLLLVDELDYTPEDVLWPTGGTGGGETPGPSTKGTVVVWGGRAADQVLTDKPTDLMATKVLVCPRTGSTGGSGAYCFAGALKPDGTLAIWGYNVTAMQTELASIGGIVDFALCLDGGYYVTLSGTLGKFGAPKYSIYTLYAGNDVAKVWCQPYSKPLIQLASGLLIDGGMPSAFQNKIYSPKSVAMHRAYESWEYTNGYMLVDINGDAYGWRGGTSYYGMWTGQSFKYGHTFSSFSCASNNSMQQYCAYIKSDLSQVEGSTYITAIGGIPDGLDPIRMSFTKANDHYSFALNSDGRVVRWQTNNLSPVYPIGSDTLAIDLDSTGYLFNSGSYYNSIAILKDA